MNDEIMLNKMLPTSLNKSETLRAINEVLQPLIDRNRDELIPRLFLYSRIDKLSDEFLNHLAYQFHVDFWDADLPIEKKRKLIKNSIKYHKYKGTPYAVEQLLKDAFDDTWIEEWFEYGGKPYFFRIYTRDILRDKNTFANFIKALNTVKNTRSWLESFTLVRDQTIYYGLYGQKSKHIKALPYKPSNRKDEVIEYVGVITTHKSVKRKVVIPEVWTTNDLDIFLELKGEEGKMKYGD